MQKNWWNVTSWEPLKAHFHFAWWRLPLDTAFARSQFEYRTREGNSCARPVFFFFRVNQKSFIGDETFSLWSVRTCLPYWRMLPTASGMLLIPYNIMPSCTNRSWRCVICVQRINIKGPRCLPIPLSFFITNGSITLFSGT